MRRLAIVIVLVTVSGCGGRVAKPVEVVRSIDASLTCDHLQAEYDNNLRRRHELTGESSDKIRDNIGMLIASPLFLDLSDTQKVEVKAIAERNTRLEQLARDRNCPALVAPPLSAEPLS